MLTNIWAFWFPVRVSLKIMEYVDHIYMLLGPSVREMLETAILHLCFKLQQRYDSNASPKQMS